MWDYWNLFKYMNSNLKKNDWLLRINLQCYSNEIEIWIKFYFYSEI